MNASSEFNHSGTRAPEIRPSRAPQEETLDKTTLNIQTPEYGSARSETSAIGQQPALKLDLQYNTVIREPDLLSEALGRSAGRLWITSSCLSRSDWHLSVYVNKQHKPSITSHTTEAAATKQKLKLQSLLTST